jgi:DNA polymerase V
MAGYRGDDTTGFQSPAQDYVESVVDLAALLDLRRPEMYAVRVVGQELRGRGIEDGDILIANAAGAPASGKVCIAFLHGEAILATLHREGDGWWLRPSHKAPVEISDEVEVWAIVKALVRSPI